MIRAIGLFSAEVEYFIIVLLGSWHTFLKISVCMATYNGESYIGIQLKSILKQLKIEDEVIIVDDCSKDNTVKIINDFNDPRIKIFINSCNSGVSATFELALKKASGDIIFLSDQDDIWMDNKVEKIINCFENVDIDIVQHDAIVVKGNYSVLYPSFFEFRKVGNGILKNFVFSTFLGCCMVFRKNVRDKILPMPLFAGYHDRWIGIMGELYFKTYFLDDKLIYYVRHGGNESTMKRRALSKVIVDRLQFIMAVISFYRLKLVRIILR